MSIRLKLLRKKLGMTLDVLAEKTGMTKSYLSKVERGLSTPSIATALKLAKALSVKVEELFSEETISLDSYSLVRSEDRQSLAASSGSSEYAVLAHQVSERSLLPFILYPAAEFTAHHAFKEHTGEEFLFVHEGQVEVDFMNERVLLNRGDALHFNAQKPHRLRSVGDVQAQLLVVVHSDELSEKGEGA
ncbi:helix-turn-helix domain-containing protein [Pseudomonas fluorescens]|uniref:helix-turn-helix domain-containing protein n=1 Tax=Pseudomonas fluorescens TaxID=294 RepID=UPI0010DD9AF6|nr:XRE family transcriptional regulator [Pseudomonas fluorescens]TCV65721.1 XRE family transcriptional regulator [Pseudomonas fluorescens]